MAVGIMEVVLVNAKGLKRSDFFGKIDPYVALRYRNEEQISKTARGEGNTPVWNEEFKFRVEYPAIADAKNYKLTLQIYDHDTFTADDYLGNTVYLKELFQLGVEKGRAELGVQKYRVVLADGTYRGEIQLGISFILKAYKS